MRIAPQGWRYIVFLLVCGLLLAFSAPLRPLSIVLVGLGFFVAFFFRDPERTPPEDTSLVVSPADGKVVYVGPEGGESSERLQVSIFLSIFDVHVNRSPWASVIRRVRYTPGRFFPAYRSEASVQNEQNEIELADGCWSLIVRQIAGIVARRIVFCKSVGDRLERGERFGLIQFGSRVDVALPPEFEIRVAVGDRVKGGESVLARCPS